MRVEKGEVKWNENLSHLLGLSKQRLTPVRRIREASQITYIEGHEILNIYPSILVN